MPPSKKTKVFKKLASLQLAIGLLITIGFMIAIGTVIEQDQSLNFYKDSYPETNPMFGFLSWKVITLLSLDRLYTAWWFVIVLLLFGSSLLACTFTTQLPSLKTFKLWKFINKSSQYKNLKVSDDIKLGVFNTIAFNCNDNNYHFFRQHKKGYAYSGLLGRIAPIVVHASIIILLLGSTLGSFAGYTAQEIVPRGEIFHVQNLTTFGNISYIPQTLSCRINNFWITYTKELKTDQFYSDLSLFDDKGNEVKRKIIFVNEPLTFKDLVLYQTDWDIVGLKLRLDENKMFQVPLKKVTKGSNRFWFGSLSLDNVLKTNLTIVANDLSGVIYLYDDKGVLVQESFIGGFIKTDNNLSIQVSDFITSTGLQIKSDPGINTVYLSFFLLIVSIYVSFFTYSQIWLVELAKNIKVGGNSNRSVLFFQEDFRKIVRRSINT
jgi:cytochrome c biogenesis protein|tara:strand:+ start:552 stop:1853 length:1302 start_codon:yes stop_codon:yes gene_type:complete